MAGVGQTQLIMALRGPAKLMRGLEERSGDASPVIDQPRPAELRNDMEAVTHDVAVPDHPREGELARAPSRSGSVRWPVSVGFSLGLASAALVLTIAMVVMAVANGDVFFIALVPGSAAAALMGGLVAVRRPGQPMGTLLSAYGLVAAACGATFAYAHAAVGHFAGSLPAGIPAMWVTSWDWVPVIAFQVLILPLVFPDGRLLSRRWRPVLWAALAFLPLAAAGNAFAPQSMGSWFAHRPNPYAVHGPLFSVTLDVADACGSAVAVAVAASVALRWHRGGHVVHQQLKWFLSTVPITAAIAVVVHGFGVERARRPAGWKRRAPQNSWPAWAPRRAVRCIVSAPHAGHDGTRAIGGYRHSKGTPTRPTPMMRGNSGPSMGVTTPTRRTALHRR